MSWKGRKASCPLTNGGAPARVRPWEPWKIVILSLSRKSGFFVRCKQGTRWNGGRNKQDVEKQGRKTAFGPLLGQDGGPFGSRYARAVMWVLWSLAPYHTANKRGLAMKPRAAILTREPWCYCNNSCDEEA